MALYIPASYPSMIPLEKQCVSLELARRLKELGVKQDSIWAWYETTDRDDTPRLNRFDEHCTVCPLLKQAFEEKYAAFTVAELDDLLPIGTRVVKNFDDYTVHEPTSVEHKRWGNRSDEDGVNARAKMLIYLVENKLVVVEKW